MHLRRKYLMVVAVPVVALLAATTLAYAADRRASANISAIEHTFAVRLQIRNVLDDLIDSETGTRGYLLTRDAAFLDPYKRGSTALPEDLEGLQAIVGGDAQQMVQFDALAPLVTERMYLLRRQQTLAPLGSTRQRKISDPMLERGNVLMTEIRARFATMEAREESVLAAHDPERQRAHSISWETEFLVLPLAVLLSLLLVVAVSSRIVNRIHQVEENALRLERGDPLDPPDRSRDEIGKLSRLMVETGTRLNEAQAELRRLATTDPLTGLMNRRGLMPLAEHELSLSRREQRPLAIAFVDVDGLKGVNDEHGHGIGDLLIIEVAVLLRDTLRASDLVARVGGDEFCVLLTSDSAIDVETTIERIQHHVRWANTLPGRTYNVSVSIGAAVRDPLHDESIDELLCKADAAMYARKRTKQAGLPTG